MLKFLSICITIVLTSFFFFPFEFVFLPGANTKMIMAALGLVILGSSLAKKRNSVIDKDFFILTVMATLVSLVGIAAVVINGTSDFTFASYVVSMWVWVSAAYMVTRLIKTGAWLFIFGFGLQLSYSRLYITMRCSNHYG